MTKHFPGSTGHNWPKHKTNSIEEDSIFNLRKHIGNVDGYTELRIQELKVQNIRMVNGSVKENGSRVFSGASARSFIRGKWGFASSPHQNSGSLDSLLVRALGNAELLGGFSTGDVLELPPYPGEVTFGSKQSVSSKEVLEFFVFLDSELVKRFSKLNSRTLLFMGRGEDTHLASSDGSTRNTLHKRFVLFFSFTTEKNGENFKLSRKFSDPALIRDYLAAPEKLLCELSVLYENLLEKADGVNAQPGVKECILSPGLTGIFAHEAVGHTVESDLVMAGSIAGEFMNKKVANPLVTLVDFASEYNGKPCPVPVLMDEEGILGEDAVIIENGILLNFLHNRESAVLFGAKPCGNGRAQRYNQEPLVRMRNTAILPGEKKLEEIISSVNDGYYLLDFTNGQADSTGEFMFSVSEGYEIVNGRIGRAIRNTTVSGIAFEVLKSISGVSNSLEWTLAGCGKKYGIPVGMGGPAIKCRLRVGG